MTMSDPDSIETYDYELPEELVAAHPAEERTESRLLVADRVTGDIEHRVFGDIVDFLEAGDLLVFNDTRVVPARIHCRKTTGGRVEVLVIDVKLPEGDDRWRSSARGELVLEAMTRSSKALRPGQLLIPNADGVPDFTIETWEHGIARIHVPWSDSAVELMQRCGETPLPPYIIRRREAEGEEPTQAGDLERYQTVYASQPGAVAAPTAGLHFSEDLLADLGERGVEQAFVTLRVGPGTFRPVTTERLSEHEMHTEEYAVSAELTEAVERTRAAGGRIVAVGTTSVRALESEALLDEPFEPGTRETALFIRPGFDFRVCDAIVTNFHLPRSTLLALVAAFAGTDFVHEIYRDAIERRYRFYSYGDAMLLTGDADE